ncbi:von Willebrand factor A domain-containing protein 3A-like isoform X3 [Oculina patagonica]
MLKEKCIIFSSNESLDKDEAVIGLEAAHAEGQSSSDWLGRHSVEAGALSFDEIMKCGVPVKPPPGADLSQVHMKYDAVKLQDYEFKITNLIQLCQQRINWLLRGSKRAFGLVKGQNVALLVDASDSNCGYGRLQLFQESLAELIEEQLVNKERLFLVSFGTQPKPLWTVVRDVNCRIVEESHWWARSLHPQGGCNVLSALKQVIKRKEIDSIVLVLGSCPDQNPKVICEYVRESLAGRHAPLHTVAYDCSISATNMFLKELAEQTGGRYHCYVSTSDEQIMTGTDLSLIAEELKKAKEVLKKIQEMKSGVIAVGDKRIAIQTSASGTMSTISSSLDLMRLPSEEVEIIKTDSSPLVVEHPSFPARTSAEWLRQHGLKAKGLNLYQVLAPNSFSYVDGYISAINRNVHSLVYERSMAQFKWHDGTVKNVHVDPTLLFDYQRHLESAVHLYKRRVDWLSIGCRRIFGTVVEKRVIVLLDMSICMSPAVPKLQEDLRLLLEQQMANKTSYNVICFGDKTEMFRPVMVEPSPEYLEATWKWLLRRGCAGSRNFLDAFRKAVENEEEKAHGIEVEGIYVVTSGVPDEPKDVVCGFLSEALAGTNTAVHTIFYEVDDEDGLVAIPGKYADRGETAECLKQMAHAVNGRFHWYRSGAIVESDDLRAVINEMDKAFNYSQKTAILLETVRKRKPMAQVISDSTDGESQQLVPRPPSANKSRLPLTPPRHTALTKARMKKGGCSLPPIKAASEDSNVRPQTAGSSRPSSSTSGKKARPHSASSQTKESTLKALQWKAPTANSTTSLIPAPPPSKTVIKERRPSSGGVRPVQQVFYTEWKNETGAVFSQYPSKKKSRRPIKHPFIPDKEDNVSTREWMRHYSLSKVKLDLNTIVGSAECSHAKGKVSSLGQSVPARYCNIFPSVEVKGVVKHLHLLPHELEDYEEQVEKVLKRYVKRLQWLLSGSRRVFGTIVEKKVVVLIDTSGSMVSSMDELKRELAALVWDQIRHHATKFNLIRFASEVVSWKPSLASTSDDSCQDAVEWVSDFDANGSTCTLSALQLAFEDPEVQGIYLLTDGKPDNSTTMVLREVAKLNSGRNVRVHCISFNCDDSVANKFLQLLASQTGGRYHRCQGDPDGHLFTHRLLTEGFREDEPLSMPVFEGDDLRRLASEIALCRKFLLQSRSYRAMFPDNTKQGKSEKLNGQSLPPQPRNSRSQLEVAAR